MGQRFYSTENVGEMFTRVARPLRELMLRVDDRSRLYADALQRRFRPQLMLRVDDLCRFYA